MADIKLAMILYRDADGELKLWACRGVGRGCKRNRFRKSIPCEDCVPAHDENETLGELRDRVERGDA